MITDLTYLKTMSGGDSKFIMEMYEIFIEQVSEYTEKMPELLREKDYSSLSKMAHKATSTLAVMGMESDAKKLKELEMKAKNQEDIDSYEDIVNKFIERANQAIIELDESLGKK